VILCTEPIETACRVDFADLWEKDNGPQDSVAEINSIVIKIKFWTKGRILSMKILTAPSLFASDLLEIGSQVRRAQDSGADILHFDIMDGVYVPNISIGFDILKAVRGCTNLPIDAHMMTVCPEKYFERLAEYGADIVTIHNDIADTEKIRVMLTDIRSYGMMSAIALKPAVDAEAVLPFLDLVDMILVMTVEPGFSGQAFMDMSDKIREIKKHIGSEPISIAVDGGIKPNTAALCAAAGANVFVAGSGAFGAPSMQAALEDIRIAAQGAYIG
jgi:ribulose-phosphate 3-epimerase